MKKALIAPTVLAAAAAWIARDNIVDLVGTLAERRDTEESEDDEAE